MASGSYTLPPQNGHGFSIIFAGQQLMDVSIQHRERKLEDDLDALVEEAVHHHHGTFERHDGQEEREEPRQWDGGDDGQRLHAVVQLRDVHVRQLLEYTLIHQSTWGTNTTSLSTCGFYPNGESFGE